MKQLMLAGALALVAQFSFAQTSDSLVWRHIDIGMNMVGKAKAKVVMGEKTQNWFKNELLEDADGKGIKFNNHIDVLNYMSAQGWEIVTTYYEKVDIGAGNVPFIHFIMRRKEKVLNGGKLED